MRRLNVGICLAALLQLATGTLAAQVVTASFNGTVLDPNGASVPGASVTMLNVDRGSTLTRTANTFGEVVFPSLPIGEYTITAEAKGFKTLKRGGVTLSSGQDLRMALALEIGQVAETIEVTSAAPLVNTANAEQRSNMEGGRVQELPMSRRDWTSLLNLNTGAQVSGGAVRLNGLAPSSVRLTVDGTDATQDNESPSLSMNGNFNTIKGVSTEAIAEVVVSKGIASAEIANTISGNVNIITKSGTNAFHGSAFWLNNIENLNARNQFLSTKPGLTFNQYGGSLGGPIVRNRAFFFAAFDAYRLRGFQAFNQQVPTLEFRNRISAQNKTYDKTFALFPLPNQPYAATSNTGAWIGASSSQGQDDHAIARGDFNVTNSTILSTRYTRARPFSLSPRAIAANNRTFAGTIEQGTINVTHARPSWTSETRFGVNYNFVPRIDNYANLYAGDNSYNGIGGLGFSIDGEVIRREGATWSLEQNFGKQIGRHSLKFGGIFVRQHVRRINFEAPILTYNSEADLINNIPNAVQVTMGVREFDLSVNTLGFFFQDDFKVNSRLVVNMGVRWDYFSVPKERDGRLFNRTQPFGTGPYTPPDALWKPDTNNFSPRLGFAYSLDKSNKTVLRGGAGIFHGPIPLFAGPVDLVRDAVDEPFRVNVNRTDVLAAGSIFRWPVSNDRVKAYVKGATGLIGDTAVNTDFPNPFSYQWTLTVQRELPGSVVIETGYVGTRGVHLQMVRFWNQVDRITGIRPVAGFTQFRYRDAGESTSFHSWQSSVRKRFSSSFSVGGNYTWASAYSYTNQADLSLPTSVQDIYNIRADKGPPDDFIRHTFNSDFVYELPVAKLTQSNTRLVRNLVHGWQVSGIFTARSGNPLNIVHPTAFAGSRADYVGGNPKFGNYLETLQYLNRSSFALVPIGAQSGVPIRPGNIGRNAIFDIGLWNLDLATTKRFYVTEKIEGKLEAQMLNSLNHTNLSGIQTNVVNSNFGRYQSTRGTRAIQLNFRLTF
jgi:hypothetical protein